MSEFVHGFVQSMTVRERSYFRRFAKLYGDSSKKNYLLLFDHFQKVEDYDHHDIKAHFVNTPIGNNWSSEINYLQGQLLKSMANFHLDSSTEMKLQKSILYIGLLIERGFQKQALKILRKSKSLAYQIEDFSTILKFIQLEEEILFREGVIGFTKKLEELKEERIDISDKIINLNQIRLIREQIRELHFSETFILNKDDFPYFYNNELLESADKVLSIRGMEHWLYIKSIQSYLLMDFEVSQKVNLEMIHFLEKGSAIFKLSKVLVPISNYLYSSALIGDEVGFHKMILKLRTMEDHPKLNKVYITYIRLARTLDLYYKIDDLNNTKIIIEESIAFIKEKESELGVTQFSYLNFLVVRGCIMTKQYALGIKIINIAIKIGVLEYMMVHSRLFLLLMYFELKWTDMLTSEVESSYKLFKRHKVQSELSKTCLKFFKSSVKTPHRLSLHSQKLVLKLEEIKTNPKMAIEFDFFDYLKWAKEQL